MSTSPSRASASGASNIPEFMPILSAGAHSSPADGACIMELASFLSGEEWTDFPACTNRVLAKAAQYANDDLPDGERQRLLPLLPRLMNTAERSEEIDQAIAQAATDYVLPIVGHPGTAGHMAEDVQTALHSHGTATMIVGAAEIAVALSGGDTVDFLSHLIDAYDKAAGRTAPTTVTEDDLRRCAELTGASA